MGTGAKSPRMKAKALFTSVILPGLLLTGAGVWIAIVSDADLLKAIGAILALVNICLTVLNAWTLGRHST